MNGNINGNRIGQIMGNIEANIQGNIEGNIIGNIEGFIKHMSMYNFGLDWLYKNTHVQLWPGLALQTHPCTCSWRPK